MPGRLRAIYVKRFKGGPMDSRETATLTAGRGLAGNANQGGRRQVILLDEEAWTDATAELGVDLDPSARRANLLLSGVRLENTRGRILRLGPARLRIWFECAPCYQMDQIAGWINQRELTHPPRLVHRCGQPRYAFRWEVESGELPINRSASLTRQ